MMDMKLVRMMDMKLVKSDTVRKTIPIKLPKD